MEVLWMRMAVVLITEAELSQRVRVNRVTDLLGLCSLVLCDSE